MCENDDITVACSVYVYVCVCGGVCLCLCLCVMPTMDFQASSIHFSVFVRVVCVYSVCENDEYPSLVVFMCVCVCGCVSLFVFVCNANDGFSGIVHPF